MCSSIEGADRTFPPLIERLANGCLSSQECRSRAKAAKLDGIFHQLRGALRLLSSVATVSLSEGRPPFFWTGADAQEAPSSDGNFLSSNSRSARLISTTDQRT